MVTGWEGGWVQASLRRPTRECELFPRGAKGRVSISTEQKIMGKLTSVASQKINVRLEGKVPEHITLN